MATKVPEIETLKIHKKINLVLEKNRLKNFQILKIICTLPQIDFYQIFKDHFINNCSVLSQMSTALLSLC